MTAEPETLLDLFAAQVERSRERVALRYKLGGTWRTKSWGEWDETSALVAHALASLGVAPGERVAIVASTRVQWVEVDVGILRAGAVTVPIYPSVRGDAIAYVLRDAGVRVLFADDPLQLEKLYDPGEGSADPWGALTHVVVFDRVRRLDAPDESGRLDVHLDDVVREEHRARVQAYADLLDVGRRAAKRDPDELARRQRAVTASSMATITYTSGTSGEPKGVVLAHSQFMAATRALRDLLALGVTDEQLLFLPLAHIFARLTVMLQLRVGFSTAFAESVLHAIDDCAEIKPTFMASVPRLYEKMYETVVHSVEQSGEMKQRVFRWALRVGQRASEMRRRGREPAGLLSVEYRYADKLVFAALKKKLGGKMRFMISGAAPLAKEIAEFFHAADLLVLEGYGLTETTAATTVNLPHRFRFGSVGLPLPGVEIRIADDGEILVRGAAVMVGYHGKPEDTREAIDSDGWLHTGDIGRIDEDGFLFVTDRKKDMLVTAGGKNIAPQAIEKQIEQSRYVSRAVVLGDRRPYLVALVSLEVGLVTDWAREHGVSGDPRAMTQHPKVYDLLRGEIDVVNSRLPSFETIKRFAILDRDLSIDRGELTPTLKVKRKVVAEHFADAVEKLYAEP